MRDLLQHLSAEHGRTAVQAFFAVRLGAPMAHVRACLKGTPVSASPSALAQLFEEIEGKAIRFLGGDE